MTANLDDEAAAARQLLALINGSWVAQACYVTARLGIADLLAAGPRTAEDLAAATGTDAAALRRLLNALGSVDICRQNSDGRFEMTRLGSGWGAMRRARCGAGRCNGAARPGRCGRTCCTA